MHFTFFSADIDAGMNEKLDYIQDIALESFMGNSESRQKRVFRDALK